MKYLHGTVTVTNHNDEHVTATIDGPLYDDLNLWGGKDVVIMERKEFKRLIAIDAWSEKFVRGGKEEDQTRATA